MVGAALLVITAAVGTTRARGTRQSVAEARREVDAVRLELGLEHGASADALVAEREAALAAASARAAEADPGAASRRLAARLVTGAERLGLDVDHVAADPAAGTVTAGVNGAVASAVTWIATLDATAGAVRTMALTPEPGGRAAVTVALGVPAVPAVPAVDAAYGAAAVPADDSPGDGWPVASPRRIASALWIPPRDESPSDRAPANRSVVADRSAPPIHIGTITTSVAERFAFRLPGSGVVCLLAPGEAAFGWRLTADSSNRFRFEKEGDVYEVDR